MVITQERQTVTAKDFKTEQKSTWCPGCGDFGILSAVQMALVNAGVAPWQVLLVSGIGCGSKLPDYISANGYMTLHGRAVSIAAGAHLANTDLVTFAITGDGDGLGIGIGHAIHNMRRNVDIVHIIENNEVYGLTKGQYSPTSKRGFKTSTSPEGSIEFSVNPLALALTAGATFIGRSYSGDPKHAAGIIQQAMEHKGYALVEMLQTCPTYNKTQNNDWYKEQTYKIEEENPSYDNTNRLMAYELSQKDDGRYPMGVLFIDHSRPTYAEQVPALQQNKAALIDHSLDLDSQLFEKIKASYN
ncbi:MAG: thiamine pyrophosphate-dependent enzyme [Candidatus Caenarcaniphilales bacterium]|nr:thiamine pyrophosphate-dependent enzyme [Candidatus Caenarcaniphilales bacterium]